MKKYIVLMVVAFSIIVGACAQEPVDLSGVEREMRMARIQDCRQAAHDRYSDNGRIPITSQSAYTYAWSRCGMGG